MNSQHTEPSRTLETIRAAVRAVMAEVTDQAGLGEIGDQADFFAAGLDSMAVAAIVARLQQRLGFDVPLSAVFEYPNVNVLVAFLAGSAHVPAAQAPPAALLGEYFPAPAMTTYLARRMGQDWERTPAPVWGAVELPAGTMDAGALRSALDTLVERHEALRVSLHRRGDEVLARLDPAAPIPLEVVDAPGADDREMNRMVLERREHLFDRTRAPMAAVTLIRGTDLELLFMVVDHNVADAWSLRMLLLEIGELCAGRRPEPAAEPQLTLSQWCAIEDRLLTEKGKDAAEFWRELLEPSWPTPGQGEVPGTAPDRLNTRRFEVGAEARGLLLERAAEEGLSLSSLLGGHLLHAVRVGLGADRVPMVVHSINRDLLGTSTLVASTSRELWLSVDLSERGTPEQAAVALQSCLLQAVSRQMTPPALVLGEGALRFGSQWKPWLFLEVRLWQPVLDFPSGPVRLRSIPSAKDASAPLDLHVVDMGSHLVFELTSWPGALTPETTDHLVRTLVESVVVPSGPLARVQDPDAVAQPPARP